jgi:cyanophycin synthetase
MHRPNHVLELKLGSIPSSVDWQAFDAWIQQHFAIRIPSSAPQVPFNGNAALLEQARHACALGWRALLLGAAWQQGAHLPALEPGHIISCTPRPGHEWVLRLAVVHLRYLPDSLLHKVYTFAAAFVQQKAHEPPAPGLPAQTLYRQLQTELIEPLMKAMPLGSSTLHLLRAAQARRLPWEHLGNGLFQVGWGSHSARFRHSTLWNDSAIGTDTAQNKYWAAQWLNQAGIPVPRQVVVNTADQAINAARQLGMQVVLKPIDRDRGEGVSTQLHNNAEVRVAFEQAIKLSAQVLVERKIAGVCHRVLVVRGKVVYVVKRLPVAVRGNGTDSIRSLCERDNAQELAKAPWLRKPLLPVDEQAQTVLRSYGLNLDTVVDDGVWAPLRDIESTQWGGIDQDFTDSIHPDNAALAVRAAAVFGLESAGVDILSTDIRQPWYSNEAAVNEVNSAPTLGAGPVSLRTMDRVLQLLVPGSGRIPIHIFIGGQQATDKALQYRLQLANQGMRCALVSQNLVLGPEGDTLHLSHNQLYDRVRTLMANPLTDALVIADQASDPEPAVFPFDQISHVEHVCLLGKPDQEDGSSVRKLENARFSALLPLLVSH